MRVATRSYHTADEQEWSQQIFEESLSAHSAVCTVYRRRKDFRSDEYITEINWSALGSVPKEKAWVMMKVLEKAVEIAEEVERGS